ncbi:hypothetical protein NCTGTJJY_CDS0142 [Serratia phage 92A1]|nr:hypothetical protein NCTGTJJY_CDS0142 [Serratia phage 92A1]
MDFKQFVNESLELVLEAKKADIIKLVSQFHSSEYDKFRKAAYGGHTSLLKSAQEVAKVWKDYQAYTKDKK